MIRKRIRYIIKNYSKKLTIYDYVQEPESAIKKGNMCDVKYVARPVFNSIKVGENKKNTNSLLRYRKYRKKYGKRGTTAS